MPSWARTAGLCNLCYYFSKVLKRCDYEAQKEVEIQMRDKEAGVRPARAVEAAMKEERDRLREEETREMLSSKELSRKWGM